MTWGVLLLVVCALLVGLLCSGLWIAFGLGISGVLLLLLQGLNTPFHDGVGGLQPVSMERSLRMIGEALGAVGAHVQTPCDQVGRPLPR